MELAQANPLLEPGYLALQSGYTRLADARLRVAAWTTMPGCKSRRVEWWFGHPRTTEQYERWHPKDHVWCEWIREGLLKHCHAAISCLAGFLVELHANEA